MASGEAVTRSPIVPFSAVELSGAVRATYAAFIGSGFAFASWASRIPQVRDRLQPVARPSSAWCCWPSRPVR